MRIVAAGVIAVSILGAAFLVYRAAMTATAQAKASTDEATRTRDAISASPLGKYIFDPSKLGVQTPGIVP